RAVGLFASGPNREAQSEFLDCLVETAGIEWTRVIGFQLEEYVGLDEDAPQSSRRFLLDRLVTRVPMAEFHGIRGEAANPAAVCENYAALLRSRPPDFAVLGIGEEGGLGFSGPPSCDFSESNLLRARKNLTSRNETTDCDGCDGSKRIIRANPSHPSQSVVSRHTANREVVSLRALSVVELDDVCRRQQVRDGIFASLKDAPQRAISFTLPAIMACPRLFAIASGAKMSRAIRDCIQGEVATSCPASLLRKHASADLFLDWDAAVMLSRGKPES
ncbi:MAG: hypothetical protein ACREEM_51565, partial [Blastocatellia bacterium]